MNAIKNKYRELTKIDIGTLKPSLGYMLACVGLAASNQPKGIPVIMNHYLDQPKSMQEKMNWIEYTRHGILKSIVLCGAPRGINAQVELYAHLPKEYKRLLRKKPLDNPNARKLDTKVDRGINFFHQVYGPSSEIKKTIMEEANSDLWNYIEQIYASPISDMTYLSPLETELEVIVTLMQMETSIQLNDHKKGALNLGATPDQVHSAERIGYQIKDLAKSSFY